MSRIRSRAAAALAVLLLGSAVSAAPAAPKLDVPIMVGGAQLDACGSVAKVVGLDAQGDGFLSVRSGPAARYREIDRMKNGDLVMICGEQGKWFAAIYPWVNGRECMGNPPKPVPYTGPCRAGWVHSRFVEIIAG